MGAKIGREKAVMGCTGHGRVGLVGRGEQTLLGGNQSAASVDVDRSAFEHDAEFLAEWVHNTSAGGLRHALANFFVEFVIRILGPRVELKVQSERLGI